MNKILQHNHISFNVIELQSCLDLALDLQKGGQAWHSHVLPPGCMHNPHEDHYALVIEDDTRGQAYIAPSDDFPQIDKQLVRMLHGDDILATVAITESDQSKITASHLLKKLHKLHQDGQDWHHHMCFPKCIFNPDPGRWSIIVEAENTPYFHESYEDEPVAILRQIELLFFGKLEQFPKSGNRF